MEGDTGSPPAAGVIEEEALSGRVSIFKAHCKNKITRGPPDLSLCYQNNQPATYKRAALLDSLFRRNLCFSSQEKILRVSWK